MADGYATAFMELVLRINKSQAERDINSIDAAPGGRKAGDTFGRGFTSSWERQKRDVLGRWVADSDAAGGQAGDSAGRSFTSSLTRQMSGIVSGFYRSTAGRGDATAGGKAAGDGFGGGFTSSWERQKRDSLGRFVADSGTAGQDAGSAAGRGFIAAFTRMLGGGGGGGGFLARAGQQSGGHGVLGGLAAGIGPNILGLNVLSRAGLYGGLGSVGLGALPAAFAGAGALGLAGAGAGTLAAGFSAVQSQVTPLTQARDTAQKALAAATTPAQTAAAQAKLTQVNQQIRQLSPALQSIIASETRIQDEWKKFTATLAPLFAGPLAQVARLLGTLTGPLHQMFAGAATLAKPLIDGLGNLARQVLPLLGQAFRAVAPLMRPLIAGLTGLLTGLLPGLITLLRAAAPAVSVLARFLAQLGSGLGGMLSAFAPVITASARILGSLLGLVTSLLPIIGQLAAIFARTLAPAFAAFAGVIQSLLPFLVTIGKIFADLASAVFGDLVAAFGALAGLFHAIAPALSGFAQALSGVFVVLENSGVFAILGDALEAIVRPLGQLISAILRGLTPILPPLIGFMSQLSGILVAGLAAAVTALLPPLTQLATGALGLLARFLPPILPLITQLARQLSGVLARAVIQLAPALTQLATVALQSLAIVLPVVLPLIIELARLFTSALAGTIHGVAIALSGIVNFLPAGLLQAIIIGVLGVVTAFKAWAVIEGLIGVVTGAVNFLTGSMARLGIQVVLASVKAVASWIAASAAIVASFIAQAAAATAAFIAENAASLGIIAGITLLVAAIVYLATHWKQTWSDIKNWARDAWQFLTHGWGQWIIPGLTVIRVAVEFVRDHWRQAWTDMKNWAADFWRWLRQTFAVDLGGFFTRTIPGWLDSASRAVSQFWGGVERAFTAGWNTVWRNTVTPMHDLFTRDLPGWFNTAVAAVARWWDGLYNAIRSPVAHVIDNVLNGLINVFDWITSHIGLGRPIAAVHPFGLQAGGRIPGYGGGDRHPALLESGETVVSKDDSRLPFMIAAFKAAGVPGYQAGGHVGQNPPPVNIHTGVPNNIGGPAFGPLSGIIHKAVDIGKITWALARGDSTALTNAFADLLGHTGGATALLGQILTQIPRTLIKDAVNWIMGAGGGASGNAIADFAMTFLGKIPYTWGGATLTAADCSGFVQAVYEHFGIHAPRTSEAQGAWVRRTGPQPGGLAFYHCLPGDQPVLTTAGPKPIAEVGAGDWVITWDEGRPAVRRVLGRSAPRRQMTYLVVTPTAELEASGNHPFLTSRLAGWEWTTVDDLRLGDLVVRYDEAAPGDFRTEPVVTVEPRARKDTFDITVDGTHCFIAGGLVVHNSPPGGPDPGHVAIIRSAGQVISQGGGMGPQLIPLHALPLLWTGIPPGGLGAAAGGGATGGTLSAGAIAALWRNLGGAAWAAANMARIAYAESGDRPSAVQQGQPPGLTGWGLYQITPTSGISQNGAFGNLLNAANNTRAAISLFASSGYGPWTSDPVGRSLAAGPFGYARGGWINEPVTGVGRYSRALYSFAEGGRREYVTPEDQMGAGGGWGPVAARLDRIAALLDAGPNRTAAGITAAGRAPARLAAHAAWIGAR